MAYIKHKIKIKSKEKRNAIACFMMALKELDWKVDLSRTDIMNFMRYYIDNGHEETIEAIMNEVNFDEYKPIMEEDEY